MYFLAHCFNDFRLSIITTYCGACTVAGVEPASVDLALEETSHDTNSYKAEFASIENPAQVRITWNGIASLWAFSQAVFYIGQDLFEAQRAPRQVGVSVVVPVAGNVQTGLDLFELSLRLGKSRFDKWVEWAPLPDASSCATPMATGNQFFLRALGWIMRHELAHHTLKHHAQRSGLPDDSRRQEFEADHQAVEWQKVDFADTWRSGQDTNIAEIEKEFERRALGAFIGLTWVAQFELGPHAVSSTHPDTVSRLSKVVDSLKLRSDSFAAEMFSYIVKVLLDPEGDWSDPGGKTAFDAACDAMKRLNRHVRSQT